MVGGSNPSAATRLSSSLFSASSTAFGGGDTIQLAGQTVSLYGALAPQPNERCFANGLPWYCGKAATSNLQRLIGTRSVVCQERADDADGRDRARCEAGGVDLARAQIEAGYARADDKSGWSYLDAQNRARAAGKGLWKGNADGNFTR